MNQLLLLKKIILLLSFFTISTVATSQLKTSVYSFTLNNGLKVVINNDPTFNEVALYLLADAGFKKEQPGQHGMAHLFEHVMLPTRYMHNTDLVKNASQHSINSNAQVFNDYVRYYLQFDKNGLDYGLIALADRLDFQVDSLTNEALQRHINNVTSEISRSESFGSFRWRPVFRQKLAQGIFGKDHPYGHEQSIFDINKSTKKDIENWFKQNYGAANATLILLGNVDTATIRSKVENYFGAIDPGKQSVEQKWAVPVFKEERKVEISLINDKNVLYKAWAVPGYGTAEDNYFRLLSFIINEENSFLNNAIKKAGIKNARFFSQTESFKEASVFDIGIEFDNWNDKEKLEKILEDAVKQLSSTPFSLNQTQAAVAQYELTLFKNLEDINQWADRITEIGQGTLYLNNPTYFNTRLLLLRNGTSQQFHTSIKNWLANKPFKATIKSRQFQTAKNAYDFKKSIPFYKPSEPANLPVLKKEMNNVTVYTVSQSRIPVVNFNITFQPAKALSIPLLYQYKQELSSFFEKDAAFNSLKNKGLATSFAVNHSTISYKISTSKSEAENVFNWLSKKINEIITIRKNTNVSYPSSTLQKTLVALKNEFAGSKQENAPEFFPLKKIYLFIIGDVDTANLSFDIKNLKATKATFTHSSANQNNFTNDATLIVKNIGETQTSFISLGFAFTPQNPADEIYALALVHLLRAKLMTNLREKNGLVYEVYPFSVMPVENKILGYWHTSTTIEKTQNTLEQINYELQHLNEDVEKRLPVVKTRVLAEIKEKYKSLASIENTLVENVEYNRKDDYFKELLNSWNNLEAEGLLKFINEKAKPQHFKTVVFSSSKTNEKLLNNKGAKEIVEEE